MPKYFKKENFSKVGKKIIRISHGSEVTVQEFEAKKQSISERKTALLEEKAKIDAELTALNQAVIDIDNLIA